MSRKTFAITDATTLLMNAITPSIDTTAFDENDIKGIEKNAIKRNATGEYSTTEDNVTIVATYDDKTGIQSNSFGELPNVAAHRLLDEEFRKTRLGKRLVKVEELTANIKSSMLQIGQELYLIREEGDFRNSRLGEYKNIHDFAEKILKIKRSTTYKYIGAFKLCLNMYNELDMDNYALGDEFFNKALRIGMNSAQVTQAREYAEKHGETLTADNVIDISKEAGLTLDNDKILKEREKERKSVEHEKKVIATLPQLKDNCIRFFPVGKSKVYYVDICLDDIAASINEALNDKRIEPIYKKFGKERTIIPLCSHRAGTASIVMLDEVGSALVWTGKVKTELSSIWAEYVAELG